MSWFAEHKAEAAKKVADATSAAQEAQQQVTQAEARVESAEQAKIELSLKLAEVVAERDLAGDVSGMPSKKVSEMGAADDGDNLQKRYAHLEQSLLLVILLCASAHVPLSVWSHISAQSFLFEDCH